MIKTDNPQLQRAVEMFQSDQTSRAKRIAERVLRFNPGDPGALELLGAIEMNRGRFQAAVPFLEQASDSPEVSAEALSRLGFCYRATRQNDKALGAFEAALKVEPKQFAGLFGMAGVYIGNGDMEKAENFLLKALDAESQNLEGYRLLTTLTDKGKDKAFLKRMQDLVEKVEDFPSIEQAHLQFGIATAHQKQGDKKGYIEHLHLANRHLQKEAQPWFEPNQVAATLSREIFTKDLLKAKNPAKAKKFTPIFIVGLPRSGSTLLEEILASHSKVFGADEMPFIRSMFVEDMTRHFGKLYPKFVPEMSPEEKAELAAAYQDKVQSLAPKSPFIIDKMVGNAFFIGMIQLILPWAKVIHIKRHPADIALSMYGSYFAPAISYANDLTELGRYFRMHTEYMDHWAKVCPGFVHEVKYEDLVKNQEEESRKLLEFCGLKWEDDVLDFHKTDRTVLTLSAGQVRNKLYSSSINKWKDYEDDLAPFIEGTGDLFKNYGY